MSFISQNLSTFNSELSVASQWETSYKLGSFGNRQQIWVKVEKDGYEVQIVTQKVTDQIVNFLKGFFLREQEPLPFFEVVWKEKFRDFKSFDSFCNRMISQDHKLSLSCDLQDKINSQRMQTFGILAEEANDNSKTLQPGIARKGFSSSFERLKEMNAIYDIYFKGYSPTKNRANLANYIQSDT